jgi:hypothetical protein
LSAIEFLYEKVEKLKDKPFKADEILKMVEGSGLKPTVVRVDNARGSIIVYFERELQKGERENLDDLFKKFFKNW